MFENDYSFNNISQLFPDLDISEEVSNTCDEYLINTEGISADFVHDFVGGITRNTYLQNTDNIHAFGCLVAVFSGLDDVFSIDGGNYKLFESMIGDSTASLHLDSKVEVIRRLPDNRFLIDVDGSKQIFDYVVLAAPLENSGIEIVDIDISPIPPITYVVLHVTLVAGQLNPKYFKVNTFEEIPINILTSDGADTPFSTFAIHRIFNDTHCLIKMFSPVEMSSSVLSEMFVGKYQKWQHIVCFL
jgi:prenylcysteine oxidase/farnesylcysteine lyase